MTDTTRHLGTFVDYELTSSDVTQIMRRRNDAKTSIKDNTVGNTGFVLHFGNDVSEGEVYPLLVTKIWDNGLVNGQVFLDGNDCLWVTSVKI